MDERLREILGDEDAWVVGGAVRDELLLRPVLDLDVACAEPRDAANRFARRFGGSVFPLSERHGAWRVVADGIDETVDFTPVGDGIDADLATRDFTFNAIAVFGAYRRDARSSRRPRRSGCGGHPGGLRVDLPRRSAPAPACGALRGRARIRHGRAHRGPAPRVGGARDAAGRRADARRARTALADRLQPPRRRRPARGAGRHVGRPVGRVRRSGLQARRRRSARTSRDCRSRTSSSATRQRCAVRAVPRIPRRARSIGSAATPSRGLSTLSHSSVRSSSWASSRRLVSPILRLRSSVVTSWVLEPGPEIGRILAVIEEERAAGTISTREEALALARGLAAEDNA